MRWRVLLGGWVWTRVYVRVVGGWVWTRACVFCDSNDHLTKACPPRKRGTGFEMVADGLGQEERYRLGVQNFDFDRGLAPYNLHHFSAWERLSSNITRDVIAGLVPQGTVNLSVTAEPDIGWGAPGSRAEAALNDALDRQRHELGISPGILPFLLLLLLFQAKVQVPLSHARRGGGAGPMVCASSCCSTHAFIPAVGGGSPLGAHQAEASSSIVLACCGRLSVSLSHPFVDPRRVLDAVSALVIFLFFPVLAEVSFCIFCASFFVPPLPFLCWMWFCQRQLSPLFSLVTGADSQRNISTCPC